MNQEHERPIEWLAALRERPELLAHAQRARDTAFTGWGRKIRDSVQDLVDDRLLSHTPHPR